MYFFIFLGEMVVGLGGWFGTLEDLGDFAVFELVEIPQVEHRLLPRGEGEHRVAQFDSLKVGVIDILFGQRSGGILLGYYVERPSHPSALHDMPQGLVGGDSVEPGGECRAFPHAAYRPVGAEQCLLEHVLGVVVRHHHAAYVPVERAHRLTRQQPEPFFGVGGECL